MPTGYTGADKRPELDGVAVSWRIAERRSSVQRLALIDPALDLRRRQIELSARLRNRGLTLHDLQHQRRLAARCPTLDLFFHPAQAEHASP